MLRIREVDRLLLVTTVFLMAIGIVMVYSTSFLVAATKYGDGYYFLKKQILFVLMGAGVLVVAMRVPYEIYRRATYPLLLVSIVTLALVFVDGIGFEAGGARRWIRLGALSFQPSEPAKLAVVIFLAYSLEAKKDKIKTFSLGFLPNIIIPGVVIGLVMAEPDFGTAVTIGLMVLVMSFVAGVRVGYLGGFVLASLPALYMVIMHFGYMANRVGVYFDPWKDPKGAGFQMVQSLLAFGSGGTWGVGLGEGKQKLFFLPEAHTDFIFSVIGEETGLVGVVVVVVLYLVFLGCGIQIALKAKDLFGTYLALGLTFLLVFQAAVNMAVVLGMLPSKGLPLPFVSYGGTSFLVSTVSVGIILNIYLRANER